MPFVLLLFSILLFAAEPIKPIPQKIDYDKQKAALGKILFFDPILSKDRSVACVSCHDFDHGGADPRPVSIGVGGKKGSVNSPTVYNAIFNFTQFWNGRAKDLNEQLEGPLHSPVEMAMSKEEIVDRLNNSEFYKKLFKKIYKKDKIEYNMVKDVIVEFEKALITPNAKFDRFLRGEIELSLDERKGYVLFKRLGCITCHNGINIGGNSFQKFGSVIPLKKAPKNDRYQLTKNPADRFVYRVPTLRNITLTAPYFHDGSIKSLKKAIDVMAYHNLGFHLSPKEQELILAFLRTLTGEKPQIVKNDAR